MKKAFMTIVYWVWSWPRWLATALTLSAILWLTLAPHPVGDMDVPLFPGIDKVVHAIMFGWLTLMLIMDSEKNLRGGEIRQISKKSAVICASAATLTGVIIEYLQSAMNIGRSFEYIDIIADGAGASVCCIIYLLRRMFQSGNRNYEL